MTVLYTGECQKCQKCQGSLREHGSCCSYIIISLIQNRVDRDRQLAERDYIVVRLYVDKYSPTSWGTCRENTSG